MTRSKIDFVAPPLDEVVMGVQYSPSPQFRSRHFGDIYKLFRDEFPHYEEQPRLAPQFELFGGNTFSPQPFGQMAINFAPFERPRQWFMAQDGSHLIQLQEDRLLLNWRKADNDVSTYPRHPAMRDRFKSYFERLNDYYKAEFKVPLSITQTEVSYINVVLLDGFDKVGDWLKFLNLDSKTSERLGCNWSEEVLGASGTAVGRFYVECESVVAVSGPERGVRFALTFRGRPQEDGIETSLDLITFGRDLILQRFCELTTDAAHKTWGRKK